MTRTAVALSLAALTAPAAPAQVITVANPSFEQPVYSPAQFGVAAGSVSDGALSGEFRPVVGTQVNAVPDGQQPGFPGDSVHAGALFQDLGVPVTPGVTYQLDVFVGSRKEGFQAIYGVDLLAGSTPIGSASGVVSPGTGDFFPVRVTAVGAGSGDLGIRLTADVNSQALFDNVRLQGVPEPSGLMLAAVAAAAVAGARWGRAWLMPAARLARAAMALGSGGCWPAGWPPRPESPLFRHASSNSPRLVPPDKREVSAASGCRRSETSHPRRDKLFASLFGIVLVFVPSAG